MKMRESLHLKKISNSTIRRLSVYYNTLSHLKKTGIKTISSHILADIEGFTPAQIRKDLSYFGSFGRRGLGYNVVSLRKKIASILGLNKDWNVILIGAGHLGNAILNYEEIEKKKFHIVKIFDKNPKLVGKRIKGIPIYDISQMERRIDPKTDNLAILTIPPLDVQSVINRLGVIGIKGVLYFASKSVSVPKNMFVINEDTTMELETLTFHITNKSKRMMKSVR